MTRSELQLPGAYTGHNRLAEQVRRTIDRLYVGQHIEGASGRPGIRRGTSCGVNAILTARTGADVLGLDVNPEGVRATRDNARRHGVGERLEP